MGHSLDYFTVTFNSKAEYEKNIKDAIEEFKDNLRDNVIFDSIEIGKVKNGFFTTFSSKEKAEEYAVKKVRDNDYEYSYAVAYEQKCSAKYLKLLEKLAEEKKKLADYKAKQDFSKRKSATVGCTKCGSKLAVKYMKDKRYCPLCEADLYSETTRTTIDRYRKNIIEMEKEIKSLERSKEAYKGNKVQKRVLVAVGYNYHH